MKKLLFVIESLACAGAEKSLVTLLNLIDYSKYEVDLQLFSYGGEFENMLPKEVNLLPELPYYVMTKEPLKKMVLRKKSKTEMDMFKSRIKYSLALRMRKLNNLQTAVVFWESARKCFRPIEKQYDIAIAYAQNTPTFYVADCINARKKFAWINASYRAEGGYRKYLLKKYSVFDKISCVSDSAYEIFKEVFPEIADKGTVIYDINDGRMIEHLSRFNENVSDEMKYGKWKILTVGRFAPEKGYDIALEACRILKERGFDFCWYALGRGPLENEIRSIIEDKRLQSHFVLLGTRANPYPYFAHTDIYVQTSRSEGFGLAIAEARMLNIPVVTTRFDAVYVQMVDGANGLVVDMNAKLVADAIQQLFEDEKLYSSIVSFQKQEKKGNYEEIDKFYKLIVE